MATARDPERRRSPRLPATVPVEVSWLDEGGNQVRQPGETECVSAHGALLRTRPRFPVPLEIDLAVVSSGRSSRVRLVGFREPDPAGRLRMAVEFLAPTQNFWGLAYQNA